MNITTIVHNYTEAHPRQQQQLQWGNHKTHATTKETIHTLLASKLKRKYCHPYHKGKHIKKAVASKHLIALASTSMAK